MELQCLLIPDAFSPPHNAQTSTQHIYVSHVMQIWSLHSSSNCKNMNNNNLTSSSWIKVVDPESPFAIKWKRMMIIIGVLSLIIDPLFLYIPNAKGPFCSDNDVNAGVFFIFFRSLLDLFHLLQIILKFCMAVEGSGPKVFKTTRNLIREPRLIALNYLKTRFIIDLFAILPFPQIIIWLRSSNNVSEIVSVIVTLQFAPRMLTMVPLDTQIVQAFGIVVRNVWSGAIYNLLIFILTGHFLGAIYYQYYLVKLDNCLYTMFEEEMNADDPMTLNCSQVHKVCVTKNKELDYGMVSEAFGNEIGLTSFTQKVIYCFVWGVRSLSSMGQTFDASFDVLETSFSCIVMIIGLVLLADLIARMQTSVQSAGAKRDQQRVKQRKLEEWTHYHDLPPHLKGSVRMSVQSEWQTTKGINDEAILNSLPPDLRCDLRNHLYKERVHHITPFSRMDDQLLDFVCSHLRTFLGAEGTYIVLQGDPVEQMVFIFNGFLQLSHHSGGRSSSRSLEPGDFFGEELITWAAQPNLSNQNPLPTSTCTVKCLSNVEAFCLPAEDVRHLHIFNYSLSFQKALRAHQS